MKSTNTMKQTMQRIAALNHYALGTSRVKVIFREGGHGTYSETKGKPECAYWMSTETYRAIPIMQQENTSPEDYAKHGEIIKASNTNIYDNETN